MENTQDTQVRIQLIGDVKGYLNIEKKSVFPLTFSISDIRDISKKKGTFSKSIVLAGDKNNNILLNNYFDVNIVAGTFNINKLQYCNVIQNGIPILENALMQLVSINKEQQDSNYEDSVTYTVLIKDSTSDFFSSINNKFLTDIDFGYLNHIYTANNVINSFPNTFEDGYRYVMPYNPNVLSDNKFSLTEFSPGIFAKTYFDNIFSTAGFRYNWVNMTGETIQFDKLIIPYVGDVIKLEKFEDPNYFVKASKTTTETYPNGYRTGAINGITNTISSESGTHLLNNNIEELDPLNLYVAGIYSAPNVPSFTNDIKFELDIEYEILVQNNSTGDVYLEGLEAGRVSDNRLKITPLLYSVRNDVLENSFNIVRENETFYPFTPTRKTFSTGTTVVSSSSSKIIGYLNGVASNDKISLNVKNQIVVSGMAYKFYNTIGVTSPTQQATINFKVKNTRVKFSTLLSGEYGYNSILDMNLFVPQKLKQSDFIKSIFTMYNIYCEVDKNNLNILNLISRDEYYDGGKIVDWTKKLSKEKTQEVKFLPELQNKKLLLTYKQDKDISNESYFKSSNEIYGQLEYTFDNEYVKDVTKQELIFSPTPMTNSSFGAVCPMWAGGYPNLNLRILYAGGLYSCDKYTITDYNGSTPISGNTYPFNAHWDKPINPTFDINFGVCSYYFMTYDYGAKTNNNLFNLHWRRTLEQINNGKLLTAYFNLNEVDINAMKLSDKIRIDNSWWNINSITDYDANSKSPTKVELISIDEGLYIPYQERQSVSIIDSSPLVSIPRNRMAKSFKELNNINFSTGDLPINGVNNIIGNLVFNGSINGSNNRIISNSTVIGDNNNISEESFVYGNNNQVSSSAIVFGNYNTIPTGITNSFIVGDTITANTSNTFYADNIIISSGGTINNTPFENVVSQLEKITEGSNTGWRLYGQDPLNYGNIGDKAIDLSISDTPSSTNGATGSNSFVEGYNTISDGYASHAEGTFSRALAGSSHAEGSNTLVTLFGSQGHAEGVSTIVNLPWGHAGGNKAITTRYGEWTRSSSNSDFFPQYGIYDLSLKTTTNTLTEMFIGDVLNERVYIEPNVSLRYNITAIAIEVSSNLSKEWSGSGLIKTDSSINTTMVGSNLTSTFSDSTISAAVLTVAADNANNCLSIKATGITGLVIYWYVKIEYIKLTT